MVDANDVFDQYSPLANLQILIDAIRFNDDTPTPFVSQ